MWPARRTRRGRDAWASRSPCGRRVGSRRAPRTAARARGCPVSRTATCCGTRRRTRPSQSLMRTGTWRWRTRGQWAMRSNWVPTSPIVHRRRCSAELRTTRTPSGLASEPASRAHRAGARTRRPSTTPRPGRCAANRHVVHHVALDPSSAAVEPGDVHALERQSPRVEAERAAAGGGAQRNLVAQRVEHGTTPDDVAVVSLAAVQKSGKV